MATTSIPTGYPFVVAAAFKGDDVWQAKAYQTEKPDAASLAQLRAALPNHKVRVFPAVKWDSLPMGQQSGDWVLIGGRRLPRYEGDMRD